MYGPRDDNIRHVKNYNKTIYEQYCKRRNASSGGLDIPSIYYPAHDAIVTIFCTTNTTDDTVVEQSGSGFFIGKYTIVTAAHVVMYDNTNVDRSPPVTAISNPAVGPAIATGFARVATIKVRVNNVNGKGQSYFYNATLLGMSPSFDLAVLQISTVAFGCANPPLKDHPILEWGCSQSVVIGEKVLVVGDSRNSDAIGLAHGIVVDNLYSDNVLGAANNSTITEPPGYWGFEAIVSDAQAAYGNSGGPLLNDQGRVIGVISGIDTSAYTVAPPFPVAGSESNYLYRTVAVASKIAKRIVRTLANGCTDCQLKGHLEEIIDPLGNYYRYNYGYLGVTGFYAFGPDFLRLVPNSTYQKQKGFVITAVDPNGPLNSIFPASRVYPYPNDVVPAPAVTSTSELYLVTELNGTPVGVGPGQIPFSTITFREIQNMAVVLNYRLGSENFQCPHQATIYLGYLALSDDLPPNKVNQLNNLSRALPSRNQRGVPNLPLTRSINLDAFSVQNFISMLNNPRIKATLLSMLGKAEGVAHGVVNIIDHLPKVLQILSKIATSLKLTGAAKLADQLAVGAQEVDNSIQDLPQYVGEAVDAITPALRSKKTRSKEKTRELTMLQQVIAEMIVGSDLFQQAIEEAIDSIENKEDEDAQVVQDEDAQVVQDDSVQDEDAQVVGEAVENSTPAS